jgi:hypothetical protein
MNRSQFGLTLFAAGFCLAFLGSGLMAERQPAWDSREDQSALLNQQTSLRSPRDFCVDTKTTVSKWQRPRIFRAVGKGSAETGLLRGVKLSLVSFFDTASVAPPQIEPDNNQPPTCTFASVTNGGANANCSTAAGDATKTSCSVSGTGMNGIKASCSTIGGAYGNGGPGQKYCSANAGNNANPIACSAYGSGFGVATPNSCSAGNQPTVDNVGQPFTCSIDAKQNPGAGATNCSAGLQAGSDATQCSSDTASGVTKPGQGGACSASNAQGNGQAGGSCSVLNDGNRNYCSTTQGSGSTCSVLTGNAAGAAPMTCSIQSTFTQAYCTANYPNYGTNPAGASCSAQFKGGGGCSVITATGVNPPNANTGYCGTPP